MSPEINTALVVLVVGMITVFIILGLVVLTGDVLIRIVNKYFPAPTVQKTKVRNSAIAVNPKSGFTKSTLAAIVAAVDVTTGGKGKVKNIKKLK